MTDKGDSKDRSDTQKARDAGAIIDAAAHRRPRVHGVEGAHMEETAELDFLSDIPFHVTAILGETTISLGEVVALETGSVVQLDKLSGDPIDIYVENQKLGTGEVVVLHEKIRIRLLEITPPLTSMERTKTQAKEEE